MALNFGLLDTSIPERLGAMPANALAMRRQRLLQDEQIAVQREQQQMQNALAQMQMRKAQGEMEEDAAYKAALGGVQGGDYKAAMPGLMQASPSRAMALQKQLGEQDRGAMETTLKRFEIIDRAAGQFAANPTRQTAYQSLQMLEANGTPPELIAQMKQRIDATPDEQLPKIAQQFLGQTKEGIKAQTDKLFGKPIARTLNLGGSERVQMVNPYTGEVVSEQTYGKTLSPGEIAADARARASLSQSERQFQATQGLQRERLDMERTKSAAQPSAPAQKASDAREVLQLLDQAGPLVDQATGSYIGAGIDIVGRGAGISTQGALAGAQLRAIEGMLISKMPKMSGPQSDKDVLLYKQMAGQIGDPTIPSAQKKAAMSAIRQINERYAVQPAARSNASATNARGWALHTDANGNQAYVSPDGTQFEELR